MSIRAPYVFILFTGFALLYSTSAAAFTLEKGK